MKVKIRQYGTGEKVAELRDYVSSVLTRGTASGGMVEDLDKQIETVSSFIGVLVEKLVLDKALTLHEITQSLPGEGWTKLSEAEVRENDILD